MWIVKLTNTGTITWQESLGGTASDQAYSIGQTSDGGYIVAGRSQSNDGDATGNHGNFDMWIVKLTNTGAITWEKSVGGTGVDYAESIQQTSDDGFVVAGSSLSNNGDITGNHGFWDMSIVQLTSSGSVSWQKSLGGTDNDFSYSIRQTSDFGYIVGGGSLSNNGDVTGNHGFSDIWVVKLSPLVGISKVDQLIAINSFPNPTTGNISVDLGDLQKDVKATLTNSLGQVLLTQKFESTDFINMDIDAPTGIYFLQIKTPMGVSKTIKILKE
jgi:hypothetical protein